MVGQHAPVDGRDRLPRGGPQLRSRRRRSRRAGRAGRPPAAPSARSRRPACRRRVRAPLAEHLGQRLAAGPPVDRPGEAEVRLAGQLQAARGLVGLDLGPQLAASRRPRRRPGRAAPTPARRRRGGPRRPPPTPPRPARPGRARPRRRRRRHSATSRSASVQIRPSIRPASVTSPSPAQVAARRSAARTTRSNVRASEPVRLATLLPQRLGVALQPAPPLGPAGVLLPLRAGVAGVLAQLARAAGRARRSSPAAAGTRPAAPAAVPVQAGAADARRPGRGAPAASGG